MCDDGPQDENLVIVTRDAACVVQTALDALAKVQHDEAMALLRSNENGVRRFFAEKGCTEIGEALAMKGVTGSNLHMLTARNMEKDLGLDLGQQLALKNFIFRLKFIARGKQKVEEIWSAEKFDVIVEQQHMEGICPFCYLLCCTCAPEQAICCGIDLDADKHTLPSSSYSLSSATLKVISSQWADGFDGEEDRHRTYSDGVCCIPGVADPDPQYMTTTDNIDLTAIEDVDNYVLSRKINKYTPSFVERCMGYEQEVHLQPAQVVVTYVDRGSENTRQRKHAKLLVDPGQVEEICGKILNARDVAIAEAHAFSADF